MRSCLHTGGSLVPDKVSPESPGPGNHEEDREDSDKMTPDCLGLGDD